MLDTELNRKTVIAMGIGIGCQIIVLIYLITSLFNNYRIPIETNQYHEAVPETIFITGCLVFSIWQALRLCKAVARRMMNEPKRKIVEKEE